MSQTRPASQTTMSEPNDSKPNSGTPVPDLIEQYRLRRDAWIAQADELARLRDEVRGSAEREAMEIVTSARRDVRQIVMEARRELLVLSAQVQAALGEAGARPDPTALLNQGRDTDGGTTGESSQFADSIFAPEEAVKGMLDEARADMDALAEDARTVPFKALDEPTPVISVAATPAPETPAFFQAEPAQLFKPVGVSSAGVPPASRVLLSSQFPSDAVPVQPGRRVKTFVALFGLAGVAIVGGTLWWLRSPDAPDTTASVARSTPPAATPAASTTPPAAAPAASESAPSVSASAEPPAVPAATGNTDPSASLSVLVEAKRSSWVRTTVDGESDAGRVLAEGSTVRISAKKSVALRVGDAGAVFVSVNNGTPQALGRDGQVVTRQFVVEQGGREAEPAPPAQKTSPLSAPIAAGPPPATVPIPNPLPLVQPVAAATPSSATLDPAPAPAARPDTVPPPGARPELPAPGLSAQTSAVVAASRQWLDAYHRQDRAAMASLSTEGLTLADERRTEERFPPNVDITRSLDRVSVQIAADTAVLTAVMTERSSDNEVPPRVSPISQVWELRGNQWRVRQVRLVSEARLNQIFR